MAIDINIPSQVKNYTNLAGFPATGALKTIYIANDTNKTYRWIGSAYVEISASQAASWGTITGTLSSQTDLQTALNAKQDSLGFTPVPTTRTLTINGTTQDLSADRTFTISTGITIGTTAITSGTVGRVLFQGTGNVVSQSANLFFDVTNSFLGVGGTPVRRLDIVSDGTNWISGVFAGSGGTPKVVIGNLSGLATIGGHNSTLTAWSALAINSGGGNVLIGTTTDAGFKLDVNGTARVSGLISTTGGLTSTGGLLSQQTGANSGRMSLLNLRNTGGGFLSGVGTSIAIAFTNRESQGVWSDDFIELKVFNNGVGTTTTGYNFYTHNNQAYLTASALAMSINGGSVGVGIESPNASAKMQIESTTQGVLFPRMTTTQKNAIASPATGLQIYDSTLNRPCFYDGTSWITL
jgi:hypothetical protein